jgi:hypothetical protein
MAAIDCIVAERIREKSSLPISIKGGVSITRGQRNLHVLAEGLAVFAVAPITAYIAYTGKFLPMWQRQFLGLVAAGTIVVDGFLLWRYTQERRKE